MAKFMFFELRLDLLFVSLVEILEQPSAFIKFNFSIK